MAGDLDLIEKAELDTLKQNIAEIERMLKALIKSLENKPLNPLLQKIWRRTIIMDKEFEKIQLVGCQVGVMIFYW